MKNWKEYFSDECAAIDTDRERIVAKRILAILEEINALLDIKQQNTVKNILRRF